MTAAKRRIAITRKVSLADVADDWGDAYAVVTLALWHERSEIRGRETPKTDNEATEFMRSIAKKHFVSGKIPILTDDGTVELSDMTAADLAESEEVISALYLTVMGVTLDPKAIRTALEASPTLPATNEPSTDESSTKTSSPSEANQATQA